MNLPRLEYGKVCAEPGGAILDGAEHRVLGWSEGFPAELAAACGPGAGIRAHPGAGWSPSPTYPAALLVRTLTLGGRLARLAARWEEIRERPGMEEDRRTYLRGRVLVDPTGMLPARALVAALGELPLIGMAAAEVEAPLAPLVAPPVEARWAASSVLRRLLVHVVSGVPVALGGDLSAEDAFALADAAAALLPDGARALVSVGWGVGRVAAAELFVSGGGPRPPVAAGFDGTWSPPSVHEMVLGANGREVLQPGLAFDTFLRLYGETAASGTRVPECLLNFGPGDRVEFPGRLAVASRLRSIGRHLHDEARKADIAGWIEGRTDALPAIDEPFVVPELAADVLDLAMGAFGGLHEERAEIALSRLLTGPQGARLRAQLSTWLPAHPRREAIVELTGDPPGPDHLLRLAADPSARPLPAPLEDAVERALSALDPRRHLPLLSAADVAPWYQEWVAGHAALLSGACAALPDAARVVVARSLATLAREPADRWLAAVLAPAPLPEPPGDAASRDLAPSGDLARIALAVWAVTADSAIREVLVPWLRWVHAEPRDVVGHLLWRPEVLPPGKPDDVVRDLLAAPIPPSLLDRAAALLLHLFPALEEVPRGTGARRLQERWPAAIHALFLDREGGTPTPAAEVALAAENLRLGCDALHDLVRRCAKLPAADRAEGARLCVHWLLRAMRTGALGKAGASALVTGVLAGDLAGRTGDAPNRLAARLVLAAHPGEGRPLFEPATLWRSVDTIEGVLFLAALTPDAIWCPTPPQLGMLVKESAMFLTATDELRANAGLMWIRDLVRAGFLGVDAPSDGLPRVATQSGLWAAYRGVPAEAQGPLRTAVAAWAGRDWRRRVVLTRHYLADQQRLGSEAMALARDRAFEDIAVPIAVVSNVSREDVEELRAFLGAPEETWDFRRRPSFDVRVPEDGSAMLWHAARAFSVHPDYWNLMLALRRPARDRPTESAFRAAARRITGL